MSPTYPDDSAPGSEKIKAKKRARCEAFEAHHRRIMEATRASSSLGGNLIVTLEFFRWGAKYYKVTEKVDVADDFDVAQVAALDFDDQLVILKSVAHSLKVLHDLGIVHSDLKPTNVLIKRTALAYTVKLIDFDSAYFSGDPPPPDSIVGTINYYSPELVTYIQATEPTDPTRLTVASDVFTLGLIYAEYLTGEPPVFDRDKYRYASLAAKQAELLRMSPALVRPDVPPEVVDVIHRMLLVDPAVRPSISDVHATLMKVRRGAPRAATPAPAAPSAVTPVPADRVEEPADVPAAGGGGPSVLRGKGLRTAARAASAPATSAPEPAPAGDAGPASAAASTSSTGAPARKSGLLGKLVARARKTDRT
ncbi:MAG TPA: protein kinase [Mycobacteriales bacterium]|nr:protein kinase [Mycobacteriales bacterium]